MTRPIPSDKLDKQGYLGELSAKSTQELNELLRRQKQMLTNVKFVQRLSDKGEKIGRMVERLQELLEQRADVDHTATMFQKMALAAEVAQQQRIPRGPTEDQDEEDDQDEDQDRLRHLVHRVTTEKTVHDERDTYINSYDRVMQRAEGTGMQQNRKFFAHRTVHAKDMDELEKKVDLVSLKSSHGDVARDFDPTTGKAPVVSTSDDKQQHSAIPASQPVKNKASKDALNPPASHKTLQQLGKQEGCKLKKRYDESLMPSVADMRCSTTKLIDVHESATLQVQQKRQLEQLQGEQAAARLAQRLHFRMAPFQPEGDAALAFRDHRTHEQPKDEEQEEQAVDSDDAELDYPD